MAYNRKKELEKVYTQALNEGTMTKSVFNKAMTRLNPDFNPKTHKLMTIPKKPPKKTFVESYMADQERKAKKRKQREKFDQERKAEKRKREKLAASAGKATKQRVIPEKIALARAATNPEVKAARKKAKLAAAKRKEDVARIKDAAKRKAYVARIKDAAKRKEQSTKPPPLPAALVARIKSEWELDDAAAVKEAAKAYREKTRIKVTSKEKKPAFKQLKTKINEKDRKTSLKAAIDAGHLYYWKNGKKMAAVSRDMLKKAGGMTLRTFMNMQEKKKRIRGKAPLVSHKKVTNKITKVASRKK